VFACELYPRFSFCIYVLNFKLWFHTFFAFGLD
jgi:hypothetical protein